MGSIHTTKIAKICAKQAEIEGYYRLVACRQ
jgi:hypothetical protein